MASRIGLIARADNSGLGIQTYEFYKHMKPTKTMVVDISKLNGNAVFPERYLDGDFVRGIPTAADIDRFLQGLDVVFVAEAPYNYHLYARAKELGVKVAVQYNYEFFDWFVHPDWPMPDMLIAPSLWHYEEVDTFCEKHNIEHVYLHCPVNRDAIQKHRGGTAETFLHAAGRSAAHDRNGTKTVIEASALLATDAKIVIHFQGEQGLAHQTTMTTEDYKDYARKHGNLNKLTISTYEAANYSDLYMMGDVLLLPRRYGGNCLPLNEALAANMPCIMTDIEPNNRFLPHDWLIPATKVDSFTPRTTIDIYEGDAHALAAKIDKFYNMDSTDFAIEQEDADNIAEGISWQHMVYDYTSALEGLCTRS